ncbi:L,D-transpeptidase [Nocardioides dongkuii]|uniref:L,D-transpeptidase n=1 Tax=Nocardioides dongkuii TaxID=2760089 RepID=UPI0015FD3810|nr:L,D-transpeptidase [Nocardioides dongkuii]
MSRHRATRTRPRYGRISVLGVSLAVTAIAVLGGTGVLPADDAGSAAADVGGAVASPQPTREPTPEAPETPDAEIPEQGGVTLSRSTPPESAKAAKAAEVALPPESGAGRRVVFSESRQRVWLVEPGDWVRRTYEVSGSIYENLEPGTFEVYSRSEDAVGIEDSGTMKYFVRFTRGPSGAAIGFHDIPVDDGERVQTFAELGTPRSHGCIRQRRSDARLLWEFAPLGTTVVVTA